MQTIGLIVVCQVGLDCSAFRVNGLLPAHLGSEEARVRPSGLLREPIWSLMILNCICEFSDTLPFKRQRWGPIPLPLNVDWTWGVF